MSDTWTIYTDGGSRGNPGPAAYAYVIKRPGETDIAEKCYLGHTTNNVAEYTGLIKALEHAKDLGGCKLLIHSDSELMVKQMNGQYRVKNAGLLPLYQHAVKLRKNFDSVTLKHVRREYNQEADALCNEAMDNPRETKLQPRNQETNADEHADNMRGVSSALKREDGGTRFAHAEYAPTPLQQALELLRQNAICWAKTGDPTNPPPGEILHQLWEIIQRDRGVDD